MPKRDLESLRLLTEHFEFIRNLLTSDSGVQFKTAVILLDSVADTLMYDIALREFDRQSAVAAIRRPKYDPQRREKIRRDFREKLSVTRDLDLIAEPERTVLQIGHSYRNAAYHRDSHNPRVSGLFGRVLLSTVMDLFVNFFDVGITVGGVHESWLEPYGIRGSSFSFAAASRAVAVRLTDGIEFSLAELRSALEEDLTVRVGTNEQRIIRLPPPFDAHVDEGLKRAEFDKKFPQETFFGELHELHYKIVGRDSGNVSPKQYMETEDAANARITSALASFTPMASLATLQAIKDSRRLAKAQNVSALLLGYEDLDSKLNSLEDALDGLEEAVDKALEYVDNLRRGK